MEEMKKLPVRVRMLQLISDLEPIKKIKKGEGGAIYSHYAHNDVQQAVMALLPKYYIFMTTTPIIDREAGVITMMAKFEDAFNPTDFIETSTPVIIGNAKDEKGSGAAMSYALKYTLMRIFGLGGEDDADAQSKYITKEQVKSVEEALKNNPSLRERMFTFYKIRNAGEIQEKDYHTVMKAITFEAQKAKEA